MFTHQTEKFYRAVIHDLIDMLFTEPTESQIRNEVRRAAGLIPDVEYSIDGDYVYAEGDTTAATRFSVDDQGYLMSEGGYGEFAIEDNDLVEVR